MSLPEQLPAYDVVAAEYALPQEHDLSSAELVTRYIDSQPPTMGVFEGPLSDREDGVYFSPAVASRLGEALPEVVEVELLPGAELGAADSHHGVVFGRVAVKVGDEIREVEAAFKEYTTESEKAGREHDALVTAQERGFETFTPLAVAKDGEHTYLITQKRDELTSMDNEDWSISPADSERYDKEVVPNLHYIADALAQMHSKGIFHGDAQPKNIVRTDTGDFVAMDMEDSEFARDEEELITMVTGGWEPRDSRAVSDVWHCWYAMTHQINGENPDAKVKAVVFLEGETYETCMEEFEKNFLSPYVNALKTHSDPSLYDRFNVDELRDNLYNRVATTT